jgi:hypothetical protein
VERTEGDGTAPDSDTEPMDTTDIQDGRRHELAVGLVSRRVIDCEGEQVRRLLVAADEGERLALFVPPGGDALPDVGMGRTYRLRAVLGCDPVGTGGSTATDADGACPACGGGLRRGRTVDAFPEVRRAMERLDVEGTVGVVDERTRVRAADRPPADDPDAVREDGGVDVPSFVCRECGRGVE